jgi:hypothetical protein
MVKISSVRLVLSGNTYELYEYDKPYTYNWPPQKRGDCVPHTPELVKERRDDNVMVARRNIRRLINCNINQYGERSKFITYTFKNNETDVSHANEKITRYHRQLRRIYGRIKYLGVIEFQNKRAEKYKEKATIHYHILYFNLPYIKNGGATIQKIWEHGSVNIKAVSSVRNIGAYISKYIQKEIMDNRLAGSKAYFTSKGLKKPIEFKDGKSIAEKFKKSIIIERLQQRYLSTHFGAINYKQGIIKAYDYKRTNTHIII